MLSVLLLLTTVLSSFHTSNFHSPRFDFLYFLCFFLDVTLSILGSFKLDVTLLFWVITCLYLSPITCSHGTLLFFILSISLLSKNYLEVHDLKSVTSNKKWRKHIIAFICKNFYKNLLMYCKNVCKDL